MPHPLDGARLKIERAKEHLRSFNEEGSRYLSTEPYQLVAKRVGDLLTVEVAITSEPPPLLACVVGDFVTNLRAGLDYVAWELFVKFGAQTLSESQKRRISFPIFASATDFADAGSSAQFLNSIYGTAGAAAFTIIESVQPYHAGWESLRILNQLVNRDKHRMLLLCTSVVYERGELSFFQGNTLCWRTSGGISSTFNLGAWGAKFGQGSLPVTVKAETKPTLLVGLKDFPEAPTTTYVGVLEDALKCVANAVTRFDPFFP